MNALPFSCGIGGREAQGRPRAYMVLRAGPVGMAESLARRLVTFSEWNEETFVYGHFAMVVRPRHADFPNAWEILEVTKDKHHF